MKAIIKNKEDNLVIIDLAGEVDFASSEPFRKSCIKTLSQKNIIFNLKNLNFVGSDGLTSFMDTIRDLQKKSQLKFCYVASEFQKVFANDTYMKHIDIYEDEQSATEAFRLPFIDKSS